MGVQPFIFFFLHYLSLTLAKSFWDTDHILAAYCILNLLCNCICSRENMSSRKKIYQTPLIQIEGISE